MDLHCPWATSTSLGRGWATSTRDWVEEPLEEPKKPEEEPEEDMEIEEPPIKVEIREK